MYRSIVQRIIALVTAVPLLAVSVAPLAVGGPITTETVLQLEQRQTDVGRVQTFLAREEVRSKLLAMGVDPEAVAGRVAALTEEELRQLSAEIDQAPAGGALAVLGVVLVVLIVLDLLGVTNVFTRL